MATPFSQVIVRDSFTRANSGNLGANWTANSDATTTGTLGIVSNAAQPSVGGNAASFWNANAFAANQYSQVILNESTNLTNTHGGGPTVRGSAGGYYRLFCNTNNQASNGQIAKIVAGTFTDLGDFTATFATGDLLRLEIVGTTLTAYQNGVQVKQVTDSALSSGSPGICGFMALSAPTSSMTKWEGGDLLWTRQGTVIAKTIGNGGGAQESSVAYDINPQILTPNPDGKIFKFWYTNGWTNPVVINYAESADGKALTQYVSNPVINNGSNNSLHSSVFPYGGSYYAYVGNDLGANTGNTTQFDLWQSANGVTGWSLTHAAVLSVGAGGAWDHTGIADPIVIPGTGTWYMLYQGRLSPNSYSVGLATSADQGVTWVKYVSNPVIPGDASGIGDALNGKTITQSGGLFYLWGGQSPTGGLLPTDLSMWSASALQGPWTACTKNPMYIRVVADEGPNLTSGQVADASLVEVTGTTYLYYDATTTQGSGQIHINMANAPYTMLELVGMIFGAFIITGSAGIAGATVSYTGTATGSVTADAAGNYVLPLGAGTYTITPSLTGYTFSPTNQSKTITAADVTGANFTAASVSVADSFMMMGVGT